MEESMGSAYATPARPVTRDQFYSLRQKMVRESPGLYRSKVLSDPSLAVGLQSRSAPVTPAGRKTGELAVDGSRETHAKQSSREEVGDGSALGNFESPVLGKLASRTVNKELETQVIVTNLIALAIWDLVTKFSKIFLDYSPVGRRVLQFAQERFWKWKLGIWIYRLHRAHPRLASRLSLASLDTLLHLVVAYNVVASLWRLFARVKVDDLHLTTSQKELLGLDPMEPVGRATSRKPHVILDQGKPVPKPEELRESGEAVSATPFLFKSLETPLKAKQREQRQQIDLQRQGQDTSVSKVNAFGSNFNKIDSTPVGPSGYIPSSKYAYMMSSPSPRKRM